MTRRRLGALTAVLLGALLVATCSKSPSSPTGSSGFSTKSTAGEPSESDWADLASAFASGAVDSLVYALEHPNDPLTLAEANAPPRVLRALLAPPQDILRWDAAFPCCEVGIGGQPTGTYYYVASGVIRLVDVGSGRYVVEETMSWQTYLDWDPSVSTQKFKLSTDDLRIVSTLVTKAGQVDPVQEFRLVGTLTYFAALGQPKTEKIDVVLRYKNFPFDSPTGTGNVGPVDVNGRQLPSGRSSRCSRPREGCLCIPNCTGNAPCTKFPPCGS